MVFHPDEIQIISDFGMRIVEFKIQKPQSFCFLSIRNQQSTFRNTPRIKHYPSGVDGSETSLGAS